MIAYPGAHNLDVVGPLEILATTAYFASDGEAHYDIAIVAAEVGPLSASSGLTITASLSFEDVLGAGAGALLGAADDDADAAGGTIAGALAGGVAGAVNASERREAIIVACLRGRGHRVVG